MFFCVIGDSDLRTIQGVVTTFCTNYGWIDGSIYFSTDVVTGNVPLRAGQKVTALVEEDKASHVLKAIKVRWRAGDVAQR